MKLRRTTEDYLKTIYILSKTGEVHGAAIAERLGVSRPTVSISLKALKQEGYITQDDSSAVWLTEAGLEIARATYERHQTFQTLLEEHPEGVEKLNLAHVESGLREKLWKQFEAMPGVTVVSSAGSNIELNLRGQSIKGLAKRKKADGYE